METCDDVRRELLGLDLDEAGRRRVAVMLSHAESCPECSRAMRDFDHLRKAACDVEHDAAPPHGWAEFEAQLTSCLRRPKRSRPWGAMGLAASVVLAVVGWGLYIDARPERVVLNPPAPPAMTPLVAISPQDVDQGVRLFDQVSQVFDHRTSWVLVANGSSDVGLAGSELEERGKLLLVRLTLSRGRTVVSSADLVIVAGRSASLTLPVSGGPQVQYQVNTSAQDADRLRIGARLQMPGEPDPLGALMTELQVPRGRTVPAGEVVTARGRYQVSVEVQPTQSEYDRS